MEALISNTDELVQLLQESTLDATRILAAIYGNSKLSSTQRHDIIVALACTLSQTKERAAAVAAVPGFNTRLVSDIAHCPYATQGQDSDSSSEDVQAELFLLRTILRVAAAEHTSDRSLLATVATALLNMMISGYSDPSLIPSVLAYVEKQWSESSHSRAEGEGISLLADVASGHSAAPELSSCLVGLVNETDEVGDLKTYLAAIKNVLTARPSDSFIYTNDVLVLVDILLRHIRDVGDEQWLREAGSALSFLVNTEDYRNRRHKLQDVQVALDTLSQRLGEDDEICFALAVAIDGVPHSS